MGYKSHSIEKLGEPFLLADEMVFYLPKGGDVTITKDQFKILFVLKGECLHQLDEEGEPKAMKAGDILVCPGFRVHRYINPDKNAGSQVHVMRLFLDGEAVRKRVSKRIRRPEFDLSDFVYHHFTSTVQLKGCIDGQITKCLNDLRRETEECRSGYRHRAKCLCTDLLILVARLQEGSLAQPHSEQSKGSSFIVVSAKEYILKNLEKPLTLGEIAWHTGKGEEHLARIFKRDTGQSVFDFVREMRINQAKTYLLDSALSLTKIASLCGFSSLSFFSRTFRDKVGISPSRYREHLDTSVTPGPSRSSR